MAIQEGVAVAVAPEVADAIDRPEPTHRFRKFLGSAVATLALGGLGAGVGYKYAEDHPAHLEVAGTETSAWAHLGQNYNELDIKDDLRIKIPLSPWQTVAGETVGARLKLNIEAETLEDDKGNFDPQVLSAYLSLFNDREQITSNVEWAIAKHDLLYGGVGGGLGLLLVPGMAGYRRFRRKHNAERGLTEADITFAHSYYGPERRFVRRTAMLAAMAIACSTIPGSQFHAPTDTLRTDPAFAGTILENAEVTGVLKPLVVAGINYYQKFTRDTEQFYDQLEANQKEYLATDPVQLPSGPDVENIGFVTDRHCNTGMDRVTIALFKHYGIKTIVSGGDDDLNGSFKLEAGCTSGFAQRSRKAGIEDDFIEGNHDDDMTAGFQREQGIHVLDYKIRETKSGLWLVGAPDPRQSRWGQGIQPSSSEAQKQLVTEQGKRVGELACKSDHKLIAVLHDPLAGKTALQYGCGNIVLALDGHTHKEAGPTSIALPDGGVGYQFTGGTAGGAPGENQHSSNLLDNLTVGPLQHDALGYIVSTDRKTGELIAITGFDYTPDLTISATQKVVSPDYLSPQTGQSDIALPKPAK